MRKLKLQVQMSIDGYVAGPDGEMDWMTWNWDDALKQYVTDLTESMDCIILGRKLAEGFIPHWANVAAHPDNPDYPAGKKFTDTPKVVFTRTLEKSAWDNTVLAKGELAEEIHALKQKDGKDIIVYGGASFVSHLIQQNLIDEYHLFVNPTAIGKGMPVFSGKTVLKLEKSIPFECGITVLVYRKSSQVK